MPRVLLVEDNEVNREMLRKRLERRGFEIVSAESGEQGLDLARSNKLDAVLMDLGLPGIDGWETTRRLRADPATANLPIIVLSAHVTLESREKAFSAGCDDFEAKPVQLDSLVTKLTAAIAKRSPMLLAPVPPVAVVDPNAGTQVLRIPRAREVPAAAPQEHPTVIRRATPSAIPQPAERPAAPRAEAPASPESRKHILVVEDNDANRVMLCRRLQKHGYETTEARDGREAIDLAHLHRYDLMLCDIMMPEVDGYQVLQTLKADEDLKALPIIMISAVDEMASVVRCIEMGAEDYLQKPYDPVLLHARINACLDKRRARDEEMAYLRAVADLTQAATMLEQGQFEAALLDGVSKRDDPLGRLSRMFVKMAREVQSKVQHLTQEVQRLRVEIDEARKSEQVSEITDSSYFQELQQRAAGLRRRSRRDSEGKPTNPPESVP